VERAFSSDAFGALGLPARFDLDPQVIEAAFHERSKALHPDRFATAPAAERVAALSKSRALNDAYQVVRKPVPRAEHLLAQRGVTIGDNERLDPTFLMEILEEREALTEARVRKDLTAVGRFQLAWKAKRTEALTRLGAAFTADDLAVIKTELILLRYIDRYLEECDAALDDEE